MRPFHKEWLVNDQLLTAENRPDPTAPLRNLSLLWPWERQLLGPRRGSASGAELTGVRSLGPEITRAPPARSCEIRRGAHGPAPRDVRAVRAPTVLPLGRRRRLPRRAALLRPRHYQTISRILKGGT